MSILKVDTINEKTTGNGVQIAGHVLQVQQGVMTSRVQVTTTSVYTIGDGFTVNITPKSTSSKILVTPMLTSIHRASLLIHLYIYRDSTLVSTLGWYQDNSAWTPLLMGGSFLDSPSTASQITYSCKFQVGATGGSAGPYINYSNTSFGAVNDSRSTITAMEIAQ